MKRTKKQTVKQCLTGVLSGVMLMSTMPAAFAAGGTSTDGFTFTQPAVVDCFYNFDGYSKVVGTSGTAENLPNGFNAYALEGLNYRTARLGSAATDGNTYLQFTGIGSHSGMKMKFDETIRTGKLLISFDMRIEDLSKFQGFKAIMNDTGTDDNNNVDNWWAGTYQSYSTLIDFAGGSVYVGNGNTDANKLGDISSSVGTTWHKYEILIDLDADRLYAKIDSGEYKDVGFGASVKTLDFSTSEHKTNGVSDSTPLDMDNLCIKHFPDGAVSNYMTADYNAAGNDSNVFVAFSQCVDFVNSEPSAQSSEFKAVNIATGVEVECDDAAIDGTSTTYPGVKLTFKNMPAGTYKIVCAKPAKYSYPTDSNSFSTAGAVQNVEAQSILAEDDFENYHGGMPANAVNGYLEKATTAATKADGKDGGSAMELSGAREQIIYRLPQSVTSGKLTYEFDVNHTNGLWFTGVLGAECFETDTINANTYGYSGDGVTAPNTAEPINTKYTAAKDSGDWTEWNAAVRSDQYWLRRQTTAIGNYIKDGLDASVTNASVMGNISKSDGLNTDVSGGYQGVINDLSAPANQWNHVKVVVDLDASSYIVTVGNTTKTYRVYSTRFTPLTRYKKRMVNGVEKWVKTQEYGIEGISLGKFDDSTNYASTVKYDNFKVYTDTSYYDYSDYNGDKTSVNSNAEYNNYQPAGWIKYDYPSATWVSAKFSYAAGKNSATDTNDKALGLSETGWRHMFNKTITQNSGFEIEFDIKAKNKWNIELITKDQVYTTYEKEFNNITPYESITGSDKGIMNCASGSDTAKPGVNWLYSVERVGWGILGVVENTRNDVKYTELTPGTGYWSYVPAAQHVGGLKDRDFPDVSLAGDGQWYHVRLCGKPSNGKIAFTAYLDDQSTGEWTSNVPAATEIAGIAFSSNTPANTVYIDNFAVKELTTDLTAAAAVNNVYLTKAVAVNVTDGRESELKDGFALRGQEMKIEFSESVKSTDGIKVYKYNPDTKATTEVEAEIVLEADKKTAAITLSGVEVGDKLTLEIPNTIESASSSNLSRVEGAAVAFEITDALPDEIVVTDYRLYKWHEGGKYTSTISSADAWVPATENDVKNATAADKFNFVAKGYNTGANTQLVMVKALKDPETTLLTDAKTETITVSQYGEFEQAISEDGFGLSGINGSYATYLWKADAFEPVYDKYEFTLNTAASAE